MIDRRHRVRHKIKCDSRNLDSASLRAFVQAEHIESLKPAAFLTLTVTAGIVLLAKSPGSAGFLWLLLVPLLSSLISLFTIVRWVDRFNSPAPDDKDFMISFQKVRGAFWIWLAVMLAQVVGLLSFFRTTT